MTRRADRPPDVAPAPGAAIPAYQHLATAIQQQIISGQLKPGDRLPTEPELSVHYGVSRNTAREALRLLASQGLLLTRRGVGGGAFVTHPSPEQISESLGTSLGLLTTRDDITVSALLEIREMLELPATELAALRRTDTELAALRDSLFTPDDVDPAHVYHSNRAFHTCILRASHNPLLEVVAEPVFRVLKERFLREFAPPEFWKHVDQDHREIIGFISNRDQAGAREANRAHLRYLRVTYEQIDRDQRHIDT